MSKKLIKKAVIPAAGLGTRFLPATKSVPKELLPIVDMPTIQLIVEEIASSGIETVILITSKGKASIADHFDVNSDLHKKLLEDGKHELAAKLKETSEMVNVVTVRQGVPRGLGHAVLCARDLIGDEPFAVLLGDDLVDSKIPCTKQMIDVYEKYNKSVVALMEVEERDVSKFGICGGTDLEENVLELNKMIEKPAPDIAPSKLAIVGRYILEPKIFEILESTDPGTGNEIQLTDAMSKLMASDGFLGYKFKGERFDAGDKLGFVKANINFALKRPEIAPHLVEYMKKCIK